MNFRKFGIADTAGTTAEQYDAERAGIVGLPAFRKLAGLYQFAINYEDPTLQNRIGHCLDAADVACELAKRLELSALSQKLASNIALAHDIGHPPFSHWGQTAIEKRLAPLGGSWDHDNIGLLVLTDWTKTPQAPEGLVLSAASLEGMAKRFWRYDAATPAGFDNHSLSELPQSLLDFNAAAGNALKLEQFTHLEGQLAAQSDRISFNASDIQDGLRIGRLTPAMLKEHFPAAHKTYESLLVTYASFYRNETGSAQRLDRIIDAITADPAVHGKVFERFRTAFREYQMGDLLAQTRQNLESSGAADADGIRTQKTLSADFSPGLKADFRSFMKFCREVIFAQATAPLEPLVDAAFSDLVNGGVEMKAPYNAKLDAARTPLERGLVVAEYMTREMTDADVIEQVREWQPQVYQKHFRGFEEVQYPALTDAQAFQRLTAALNVQPAPKARVI